VTPQRIVLRLTDAAMQRRHNMPPPRWPNRS